MNPKPFLSSKGLPLTHRNILLCDAGMALTTYSVIFTVCAMALHGFCELDTLARLPLSWRLEGLGFPFTVPVACWGLIHRWQPAFALGVRVSLPIAAFLFVPFYLVINLAAGRC
jgi:hypothetical protein